MLVIMYLTEMILWSPFFCQVMWAWWLSSWVDQGSHTPACTPPWWCLGTFISSQTGFQGHFLWLHASPKTKPTEHLPVFQLGVQDMVDMLQPSAHASNPLWQLMTLPCYFSFLICLFVAATVAWAIIVHQISAYLQCNHNYAHAMRGWSFLD